MWQEYAPDARMRLNLGIRRRLAPLLDNDVRKIAIANSILFTLPGSPIVYYGDEIAMGDNIWLDDRNGVRTPMQWDNTPNGGFSVNKQLYTPVINDNSFLLSRVNVQTCRSDPASIWNSLHNMITTRKSHPALGDGTFDWIDCKNQSIFSFSRSNNQERLLILNNLSASGQNLAINFPAASLKSLLTEETFISSEGRFHLTLRPFGYLWLKG